MPMEASSARNHADMREVLLEPDATAPESFYYMLRGGPVKGNVTVWEPGRAGREYIKTFGHYHTWDFPETYRILAGEGVAILQRRGSDDGVLEEVRVIIVKAGDTLRIAPGYGHTLYNTGSTFLITVDDSPSNDPSRPHADYEPIRAMKGFAYYLVEANGAPALVRNAAYTKVDREDLGGFPVIE